VCVNIELIMKQALVSVCQCWGRHKWTEWSESWLWSLQKFTL